MKNILDRLGLEPVNAGTWSGAESMSSDSASLIESINPANNELIASVRATTADEYEAVVKNARAAYMEWRKIPAPVRGDAVRLVGNALRDNKDALGSLVTLEMGKIKAEGDGEVQEMIDIADFAVGQSRMLYGNAMHSERPNHRMYEQWHPLGVVGIISAFNFPVAVWSWNALIAAICGNTNIWKPSPKAALCGVAVQHARLSHGKIGYIDHFLNFAITFCFDLAHLQRYQAAKRIFVVAQRVANKAYCITTNRRGNFAPLHVCGSCILDDRFVFVCRGCPHTGDQFVVCRVD